VVAEQDPGIGGNWVDAFGHTAGIMGLRLIKTAETCPVTTHLVPLARLRAEGWACLTRETALESGEFVA
jgi:hypothetical protein